MTESATPQRLACIDCGLLYADFGLDTHVPRSQWLQIFPQEHGGVICANCIMVRAAKLPGVTVAHVVFEVAAQKRAQVAEQGLKPRLTKRISGAIKSAIDAHGPITLETRPVAAKRIAGALFPVIAALEEAELNGQREHPRMNAMKTREELAEWRALVNSRNSWHAKFDKCEQKLKLARRKIAELKALLKSGGVATTGSDGEAQDRKEKDEAPSS